MTYDWFFPKRNDGTNNEYCCLFMFWAWSRNSLQNPNTNLLFIIIITSWDWFLLNERAFSRDLKDNVTWRTGVGGEMQNLRTSVTAQILK